MNATPTVTDRLARYRPTLDAAIETQIRTLDLTPRSELRTLEEAAFDPIDGPHRRHRGSMVVIGAAAAVAVGGLTVITFNRPESDGTPAGPATTEGAPPPEATVDTVPTATTLANGAARPCDASVGDPLVPAGTLYLGAPANDQNLARPGAIFALPEGTPVVDVAARAVGLAVIGYHCNVTATAAGEGNVLVSIDPPASSTIVSLMVRLAEIDDAVAVTAVAGSTRFETGRRRRTCDPHVPPAVPRRNGPCTGPVQEGRRRLGTHRRTLPEPADRAQRSGRRDRSLSRRAGRLGAPFIRPTTATSSLTQAARSSLNGPRRQRQPGPRCSTTCRHRSPTPPATPSPVVRRPHR